jgi:hypothetical protein
MKRLALPVLISFALPLLAVDNELSDTVKKMIPKLDERPSGPVAVFKFGGGRGTSSTIGSYLADQVGTILLSSSKRQVITRDQTAELGPASQSRMGDLVEKYHAAVAVTGNYSVLQNEVSVTVFFRDPSTFIAFAGETVKLPRNAEINELLGDAEAESSAPAPRAGPTSRRRTADDDEDRSPVFRPGSERRAVLSAEKGSEKPAAAAPVPVPSVASGTILNVRLIEPIYSEYAQQGRRFRASLAQDLEQGGVVIATQHADAIVEVVNWNGKSLGVALRSIRSKDGADILVATIPVYHDAKTTGKGRAKGGLKWGAIGAVIGGVAGGAPGAVIGAGAGGAAGSTVDSGDKVVALPSETKLEFRVE